MESYRNLSGNSGVAAYALVDEGILVRFQDGGIYLYTHESAGRSKIERMRALAVEGRGLSTYISQQVRDAYAAKLVQD